MSLWKLLLAQSSMLHTLTRLECQQIASDRSAGLSTKLSFFSSNGEEKHNRDHRAGSWKTSRSAPQVSDMLFLFSLSKKERICSRHSRFKSVSSIGSESLHSGSTEQITNQLLGNLPHASCSNSNVDLYGLGMQPLVKMATVV